MQTTKILLDLQDSDPRLTGGLDIFNPDHAMLYFEYFYGVNQLDQKQVLTSLSGLDFATVADRFRMIADQGMRPIVVPWREGRARAERYRTNPCRDTARALQPYIVQVNRQYFQAVADRGLIEVSDNSIGLPTSLFTDSWYTNAFGLDPNSDSRLSPEATII
jgi:CRISPR-associated endonuclease/helicase Cas3